MSDPIPPNTDPVHGTEASLPLKFAYSATRVVPELRQHLMGTAGVVKNDRSQLAETFKMLRNQVLQRMRADGHKLIAVTSPRWVEGKSLTALNLAMAIAADYDSSVLLVDADLGGEGLQDVFGLHDAPGLGDHLAQGTPIAELLINPGIDRFVFLPAGTQAELNSAELLATRLAQQLTEAMKGRYADRYVVVDLPAALDTADALAFLPQADTTLVVVEAHGSSIADMEALAELLAPFPLIGTVMTPPPEPEVADADHEAGAPFALPEPRHQRWLRRLGLRR